MKKGNIALLGWMYFTISPGAAVKYEGLKSFEPETVLYFLLCFIIALLCCCWGAYRKYDYFYRPLPMSVDNKLVENVINYRLFGHRVLMTLLSMHMFIFYFIDSHIGIFFTFLFCVCFYFVLNRLFKKKLQKELRSITGAVVEIPNYTVADYFPLWACLLMVFAALLEVIIS